SQVSAARQEMEIDSRGRCEGADGLPGNVGIVLGVKHQDFCGCKFLDVVDGIVENAGAQLVPVFLGKAIAIAEGLAYVSHVTFVGGFFWLLLAKNAPIDDGTVGNDFFHSWI